MLPGEWERCCPDPAADASQTDAPEAPDSRCLPSSGPIWQPVVEERLKKNLMSSLAEACLVTLVLRGVRCVDPQCSHLIAGQDTLPDFFCLGGQVIHCTEKWRDEGEEHRSCPKKWRVQIEHKNDRDVPPSQDFSIAAGGNTCMCQADKNCAVASDPQISIE